MNTQERLGLSELTHRRADRHVSVATAIAQLDVVRHTLAQGPIQGMDVQRHHWFTRRGMTLRPRHEKTAYHLLTTESMNPARDPYWCVLPGNFVMRFNGKLHGYEINGQEEAASFKVTSILRDDTLLNRRSIIEPNGYTILDGAHVEHVFTEEDLKQGDEAEPHVPHFVRLVDVVYQAISKQLRP